MPFCILPKFVDKFKQALTSGRITPEILNTMSSSERRAMFSGLIGEENAKELNLLVERKLLLKHKEQGIIRLIQDTLGLNKEQKEELAKLAKERLLKKQERIFNPKEEEKMLEELASDIFSKKYRTGISLEETGKIVELQKKIDESLKALPENVDENSKEAIEYGLNEVYLKKYIEQLKGENKKIPLKEYLMPKNYGKAIINTGGAFKSFLSTLDDSFFGTQGIKQLYDSPVLWTKKLLSSFKKMAQQITAKGNILQGGDDAVMDLIMAKQFAKKNARNGVYRKAGLDIGIKAEEAFPVSLPEKIPLLGRLFKASEVAFNGSAIELRSSYFDKIYDIAKKSGRDVENIDELKALGSLANEMTGRGNLGRFAPLSTEINNLLFSGRFLASIVHFVTAHSLDKAATPLTRSLARKNLLKMIVGTSAIATLSNLIKPGSVEIDPRSSTFAKIKRGDNKYIDITGKVSSLITLMSRLVPTLHNGKWGFWFKNQKGEWRDSTDGKYGADTALDIFENFFEGKTSPLAGLVRDIWNGSDFEGKKITPERTIKKNITPLFLQSANEDNLIGNILSFIGFQSTIYKPFSKKETNKKTVPLRQ